MHACYLYFWSHTWIKTLALFLVLSACTTGTALIQNIQHPWYIGPTIALLLTYPLVLIALTVSVYLHERTYFSDWLTPFAYSLGTVAGMWVVFVIWVAITILFMNSSLDGQLLSWYVAPWLSLCLIGMCWGLNKA